jgi:protocatechuate 3,4-dioxygenase beta subunit
MLSSMSGAPTRTASTTCRRRPASWTRRRCAHFRTDTEGRFHFWTIKPASYPIPHDGTVGDMLKAQGWHPFRPAHEHFMIEAPGFRKLVAHVFVAGDPYLDSDAVHPAGQAADGGAALPPVL